MNTLYPSIGGQLVQWVVGQGQSVVANQALAVVRQGDKFLPINCHVNGVVHRLLVPAGSEITPDTKLLSIQPQLFPMSQPQVEPPQKTVLYTTRLGEVQISDLRKFCDKIGADFNFSEAEVLRSIVQEFLSLSDDQKLRILKRNRQYEIKNNFGAGRQPSRRTSIKKRKL